MLGDGRSAAVVYPDGQIGWYSPLRFDAEAGVLVAAGLSARRTPGGTPSRRRRPSGVLLPVRHGVLAHDWGSEHGQARARVAMAWPPVGFARSCGG